MEYTFTLKFHLPDETTNIDDAIERLGAAGCDDALIGIGLPGRIALEFTRDADSAIAALSSALADVKRALPSSQLIEVSPDLVGLTDVADKVGVSRQNMRKLMLNHASTFPVPVYEGTTSLWHLLDVLAWLRERGGYLVSPQLMEVAQVALWMNLRKESARLVDAPEELGLDVG